MKTILISCLILLPLTCLLAQHPATDDYLVSTKDFPSSPYFKFPGDLHKYLNDSIVYPKNAFDSNIQGTVYVSFMIEKSGIVDSVKVIKGVERGSSLEMEAVRVVSNMPKWIPTANKTERTKYNLPVKFAINDSAKMKK